MIKPNSHSFVVQHFQEVVEYGVGGGGGVVGGGDMGVVGEFVGLFQGSQCRFVFVFFCFFCFFCFLIEDFFFILFIPLPHNNNNNRPLASIISEKQPTPPKQHIHHLPALRASADGILQRIPRHPLLTSYLFCLKSYGEGGRGWEGVHVLKEVGYMCLS